MTSSSSPRHLTGVGEQDSDRLRLYDLRTRAVQLKPASASEVETPVGGENLDDLVDDVDVSRRPVQRAHANLAEALQLHEEPLPDDSDPATPETPQFSADRPIHPSLM